METRVSKWRQIFTIQWCSVYMSDPDTRNNNNMAASESEDPRLCLPETRSTLSSGQANTSTDLLNVNPQSNQTLLWPIIAVTSKRILLFTDHCVVYLIIAHTFVQAALVYPVLTARSNASRPRQASHWPFNHIFTSKVWNNFTWASCQVEKKNISFFFSGGISMQKVKVNRYVTGKR